MAESPESDGDGARRMSTPMAAIFIFNLIVGTGALALPAAFQRAGWLLATLLLLLLALTSYMTAR
jgi:amino acid permease